MGHSNWVGGNQDLPWIWCVRCGAYTNRSVRNLVKHCSGNGNNHNTSLLLQSIEHDSGTPLANPPKQLAWSDINCRPTEGIIGLYDPQKICAASVASDVPIAKM